MSDVRLLVPGDEMNVLGFLGKHPDTTMFLRSNLRAAGIVDRGADYQATWFGAFRGDELVAVAAHGWNGMLLLQAAADAEGPLADAARGATASTAERGRGIVGLIGPHHQVVATRAALGLADKKAEIENKERLYALDLTKLVVPPRAAHVRPTTPADLELCAAWRVEYLIEAMGMQRDVAAKQARADVERTHARGDSFVLTDEGGQRVSYSAFNARVEETVQIGGVWTPVEERRHGYGRAVVAGSLVLARAVGVTHALLFTGEWNVAAQKAYEALGFERIGDYGLVTFAR